MAEPYQIHPVDQVPHAWLTCFCMAFVYEAPAGGSWYRVIRVTAGPDIPVGSKVDVTWTVLTNPDWFPMEEVASRAHDRSRAERGGP